VCVCVCVCMSVCYLIKTCVLKELPHSINNPIYSFLP